MKKSSNVVAPLLASVAVAFLAGCRKPEMQRCVDQHNVVVDDSFCKAQPLQPQRNPSGGFYPLPFLWYYGGYGGFGRGSVVGGGGYAPVTGHSYSSPTTRGGFGSTFHGSEGGAHE